MIELRWLPKPGPDADRILQYRVQSQSMLQQTRASGFQMGSSPVWSDWKDVPSTMGPVTPKEKLMALILKMDQLLGELT